jgi:hypothetical protein
VQCQWQLQVQVEVVPRCQCFKVQDPPPAAVADSEV